MKTVKQGELYQEDKQDKSRKAEYGSRILQQRPANADVLCLLCEKSTAEH